jgi:hypothetical protein
MEERELILKINPASSKQNVTQIVALRFYIKLEFMKEITSSLREEDVRRALNELPRSTDLLRMM